MRERSVRAVGRGVRSPVRAAATVRIDAHATQAGEARGAVLGTCAWSVGPARRVVHAAAARIVREPEGDSDTGYEGATHHEDRLADIGAEPGKLGCPIPPSGYAPPQPPGACAPAGVPQLAQNFAAPMSSCPQPVQNFLACARGPPHSAQNFPPG